MALRRTTDQGRRSLKMALCFALVPLVRWHLRVKLVRDCPVVYIVIFDLLLFDFRHLL